MISFKEYITENMSKVNGIKTYEDLSNVIKHYRGESEVLNPEFTELKSKVSSIYDKSKSELQTFILSVLYNKNVPIDSNIQSQISEKLYYGVPSSVSGIGSLEKKLKTIEKLNPSAAILPIITAVRDFIAKWSPIQVALNEIKDKVVKRKTASSSSVTTRTSSSIPSTASSIQADSSLNNYSSLITALESHLNEYKTVAEQSAKNFVEAKINKLKEAGWDLDKLIPDFKSNTDKSAYQEKTLYRNLTSGKIAGRIMQRGMDIRVEDPAKVQAYIRTSVKIAEDNYKAFIQKMITKIGKPVTDAKLTGNIWQNARLEVKTSDGEKQVWSTKIIINFSKYQKIFNQFPTRKIS